MVSPQNFNAGKTGTSQVKSFSAEDIYKKCEIENTSLVSRDLFCLRTSGKPGNSYISCC